MVTGLRCESPDKPVRDLNEHSSALGDLLSARAHRGSPLDRAGWSQAADLLHLAGGVLLVEIDPFRFDYSGLYCDMVGDYQDAKRKAVSDFQVELTSFLFTWNAFETIVKGIRPRGWQKGKSRAVGQYLVDRYEPENLIHYGCAVKSLEKFTTDKKSPFSLVTSDFDLGDSYGVSGTGIKTTTKLRNQLVHAAAALPEPKDWGGPKDGGLRCARVARRLVLYTLQMVLIGNYSGSGLVVDCYDQELDSSTEIAVDNLLRTIHLRGSVLVT